jgi:diguanylate cyclase (GGDEF)-like protein
MLLWRRTLVQNSEPARSHEPVVDPAVRTHVGAIFRMPLVSRPEADPVAVAAVLEQIGLGPKGKPWDCGACGYSTCKAFARGVVRGRTSLRLCPPYLEKWAEEAQLAAATDALTGLANRVLFHERLRRGLSEAEASGGGVAVLCLDLDRLKQLNDQYGHAAGDEALKAVASEISAAIRFTDLAVRRSGDEFVVILVGTDLPGATRVAEALRAGVERVGQRLGFGHGAVTVSIGIAEYDPTVPSESNPLSEADDALYRAKAAGRNVVAEGGLTRTSDER